MDKKVILVRWDLQGLYQLYGGWGRIWIRWVRLVRIGQAKIPTKSHSDTFTFQLKHFRAKDVRPFKSEDFVVVHQEFKERMFSPSNTLNDQVQTPVWLKASKMLKPWNNPVQVLMGKILTTFIFC